MPSAPLVPMAVSVLHRLSRNRTLVCAFALALVVVIAISVHLTPYLPSRSVRHQARSISCLPSLHAITWNRPQTPSAPWDWAPSPAVRSCNLRRFSRSAASDLLQNSWVLVAGDSQARLLTLALLNLLLPPSALPSVQSDLFRRHSDYHVALDGIPLTVDFVWAPFEHNLTALLDVHHNPALPDVLVFSSGLWHMLHITDAALYRDSLVSLKLSAAELLSSPRSVPRMFWLSLPVLVDSMLNTEQKRERMNATMQAEYKQAVGESGILRSASGPFLLLDVGSLSSGCGPSCTADGMHYDSIVYDAALQVLLNAVLIESQQRI